MELAPRAQRNQHEYARLRAYGWLWAVFAAALAVVLLFTAAFAAVQVTDAGMAPYITENDILLVGRLAKFVAAPRRGDALAFFAEKNGPIYIGRAVGLPGETVAIYGGAVYIDGAYLDESAYVSGACADMEAQMIPAGCYFILPDAREHAKIEDPSSLIISGKNIVGKTRVRVFPFSRIALFE